ncbi:hypothetical protein D9758_004100 [Tetrapyrgos nigripes]|uniref:Arylamine N-acetyltransferase n=1 Tax=Tetrapyrgos nigripes TaxID=182062 RepID=A0A8H5LVJ0_9AGAR|nr:hypothetical protein D9758_004100 [Tetrapyrgos nigripes]
MDGQLRDGLWIKHVPSVYTPLQVCQWLSRIRYPKVFSEKSLSTFPTDLDNLRLLVRLQLVTFPFENTEMHYTEGKTMDISPEGVFQRTVIDGKGSYCFGLNGLFLQMIRGLGYRTYSSAGRINGGPASSPVFFPFVHMVLFVQPVGGSNATYVVDAAGGGSAPTCPILLGDGQIVMGSSPTETHTLTRAARSDSSLESLPGSGTVEVEWRLTVRQLKHSSYSERLLYSFIEDEFFPADYAAANIWVYRDLLRGPFYENVVCNKCFWLTADEVKMVLEDLDAAAQSSDLPLHTQNLVFSQSQRKPYLGRFAMEGNTVKKYVGAHSEVVKTFHTEVERAQVLFDVFGIRIAHRELPHILGRVPALPLGDISQDH